MNILNLNVGILGHVDCGKTSLAKVLSSTTSTACFDKNPQSLERGITIDLGFSCLLVDFPKNIDVVEPNAYHKLQYTFVDCPGHASLIKTIIGGAQIIDVMLLVVDITKGIQTQTAECIVIGEILCQKMIIVLNKSDKVEEKQRQRLIDKMSRKMKLALKDTLFKESPIVPVAANPNNGDIIGIAELLDVLASHVFLPDRQPDKPAVFSVDHCFGIRGQGTVMTGTLWQGTIRINDVIEIPSLNLAKKVKSIQIYRRNVEKVVAGDRLALCVTQFDPKLLERGVACSPGSVTYAYAAITSIHKVKYFKSQITSKTKFHISIGHETIIGKLTLFSPSNSLVPDLFSFEEDYLYCHSLYDPLQEQEYDGEIVKKQFALLEFEKPVLIMPESIFISSKLDMDIHTNTCRIAFYGKILKMFSVKNYAQLFLPKLKIFKNKTKTGLIDRILNEHEIVCKDMFKKETRLDMFIGFKVQLSSGEFGIIEGCFGQSGKIRVKISEGLKSHTISRFGLKKAKQNKSENKDNFKNENIKVVLEFRSYIYDTLKKVVQCKKE